MTVLYHHLVVKPADRKSKRVRTHAQLASFVYIHSFDGRYGALRGPGAPPPSHPRACTRTPFTPHRVLPSAAHRPCLLILAPALPVADMSSAVRWATTIRSGERWRSSRWPSTSSRWLRSTRRWQMQQTDFVLFEIFPPILLALAML